MHFLCFSSSSFISGVWHTYNDRRSSCHSKPVWRGQTLGIVVVSVGLRGAELVFPLLIAWLCILNARDRNLQSCPSHRAFKFADTPSYIQSQLISQLNLTQFKTSLLFIGSWNGCILEVKLFLSTALGSSRNDVTGTPFLYSLFRFLASAIFILRLLKCDNCVAADRVHYRPFIFLEKEQAAFAITTLGLVTHSLNPPRWPGEEYSNGLDQGHMPTPGLEGRGHPCPNR